MDKPTGIVFDYHCMSSEDSIIDLITLTYLRSAQEVKRKLGIHFPWVSIKREDIAEDLGISRRELIYSLNRLIKSGLIAKNKEHHLSVVDDKKEEIFPSFSYAGLLCRYTKTTKIKMLWLMDYLCSYPHPTLTHFSRITGVPLRTVRRLLSKIKEDCRDILEIKMTSQKGNRLRVFVRNEASNFTNMRSLPPVLWSESDASAVKSLTGMSARVGLEKVHGLAANNIYKNKRKNISKKTSFFYFCFLLSFLKKPKTKTSAAKFAQMPLSKFAGLKKSKPDFTEANNNQFRGGQVVAEALLAAMKNAEARMMKDGDIKERLLQLEKMSSSKLKNIKTSNMSQAWVLVKAYFPEANSVPSYKDKAVLKDLMFRVCPTLGIPFEKYVQMVSELKDRILNENKSLKFWYRMSIAMFLNQSSVIREIEKEMNRNKEKECGSEPMAICLTPEILLKSTDELRNTTLTACNILNGDFFKVSADEALQLIKKHRQVYLSDNHYAPVDIETFINVYKNSCGANGRFHELLEICKKDNPISVFCRLLREAVEEWDKTIHQN